jgi:hypothetical protein
MKLFLLFLSLTFISNVRAQVSEIHGDLNISMQASLKYNTISSAKSMIKLRNDHFQILTDLTNHLKSSQFLTFQTNESIAAIQTEVTRQKKLCVNLMSMDFYLNWYNDLRAIIEKDYVTKINAVIGEFLKTLTGKKVVRCWLNGKTAAKECLQYNLASFAYVNVTKMMTANYTGYMEKIKAVLNDARSDITVANTANYFVSLFELWWNFKEFSRENDHNFIKFL